MAGGRIELVALTKRFTEIAVDSVDLVVGSGGAAREVPVEAGEAGPLVTR